MEPVEPDFRLIARDALHRHLGHPTGKADEMVADLTDQEVERIAAAATDKGTARQTIKDVLTQAYDRRSAASAVEAQQTSERLRRSALAQQVLERALHAPPEQAKAAVVGLTDGEIGILALLVEEEHVADVCAAVLARAERRNRGTPEPQPESVSDEPVAEEPIADDPADAADEPSEASAVSPETSPEAAADTAAAEPATEAAAPAPEPAVESPAEPAAAEPAAVKPAARKTVPRK